MHNNFYFLRQLSARLGPVLKGFTLVSCFSQSRDELVFEFNNSKSSFFIRASLLPELSCLTFPGKFQRARRNSVDLFEPAVMKVVKGVHQFSNERSFSVDLEGGSSVIFKMHGNRSNVLLAENGLVTDIFRSNQANDLSIVPADLGREIDWSREAFVQNAGRWEKLYFTFGKPVWQYLSSRGFDNLNIEAKWSLMRETIQKLENPPQYFINERNKVIYLSLLEGDTALAAYADPFAAVNDFASRSASQSGIERKLAALTSRARQNVKATEKHLQNSIDRLAEIEGDERHKTWGDILMANLHRIDAGVKSVRLENFYDNNVLIDIPLDEKLSPQKNAERYYRKNKNRAIEISKLKESISAWRARLESAEKSLAALTARENIDHLIDLADREIKQSEKDVLPFWQFGFKGFVIWAGRDAKNNDELTLKWAHKNDLWLHARDVPGSHVIIRHQAGKTFPKDVIEYAGSIAAWNSRRKTETLCPVIVTPRKFVRKRKGDPPGAVVVEREEVILVEPRQPGER